MLFKHLPMEPPSNIHLPGTFAPCTAKAVLRQVQHSLDDSFSRLLDPVCRFAAIMPPFSGNILEMHFDRPAAPMDLAIRINRSFDRRVLALQNRYSYRLPALSAYLFDYGAENLWLEYDAPFTGTPALFFDIGGNSVFHPGTAYATFRDIVSIYDIPEDKSLLPFFRKIKALEAYVVYYGLMFSRASRSIRLTINGIEPHRLTQTLAGLGWKGNHRALEKINKLYLHEGQRIVVAVDWEDGLRDRIGIEIFDEDAHGLMQLFHAGEFLSRQHMDWLTQWERISYMPIDPGDALSRQHGRRITSLHTRINHFKFVLNDSESLSLKGYLYYCF